MFNIGEALVLIYIGISVAVGLSWPIWIYFIYN